MMMLSGTDGLKWGLLKVIIRKMIESDWVIVCNQLFDCVDDIGWKIWGVATQSAPRSVYPYKPFLTRSYITASFMGIVNDGSMLFDESFDVKEDYEIGLRHIKRIRGSAMCKTLFLGKFTLGRRREGVRIIEQG